MAGPSSPAGPGRTHGEQRPEDERLEEPPAEGDRAWPGRSGAGAGAHEPGPGATHEGHEHDAATGGRATTVTAHAAAGHPEANYMEASAAHVGHGGPGPAPASHGGPGPASARQGGADHGGAGHSHGAPGDLGRQRLRIVLSISASLLGIEVVGAIVSGSLALFADAGHMLADVAGLGLALVAANLARRPATAARTWGYRRAEVLAAAAQAAVLLAVGVIVLVEAVRRLVDPTAVAGTAMIIFGAAAVMGNAASMLLLQRSATTSMNTRAALLEVTNDALGGLAVLAAALVITFCGWRPADPLASIIIGGLILPRTWKLLREAVNILLEATPEGIDLTEVRAHLLSVEHIAEVHELHANLVATGLPVLSAHLTVDDGCFSEDQVHQLLDEVQSCLAGHFDVHHSTFQFEPAGHASHEDPCMEEPPASSAASEAGGPARPGAGPGSS